MVELLELDKQAHKFIIAYLIAKCEEDRKVDMHALIEAGIFEFLRRVVVTDIRPDVFHEVLAKKTKEINSWVLCELKSSLCDIEDGAFFERFEKYLSDESIHAKERFILKAASYIASRWEFLIVYQTSNFLKDIEKTKESFEKELEDYSSLDGVKQIIMGNKLSKIIDLSGRLRFQTRWAQTPRVPKTSVLGHMLFVAILGYFFSLKVKACSKRLENNFISALFHDFPEALTRDIISPVKYSVVGLDEIISEFEIQKIKTEIMPYIPDSFKDEFLYILGIKDGKKDEFENRICENKKVLSVDSLEDYNEDKYNAIDGKALKNCDILAAFLEATISIEYGIKSKELIKGKEAIRKKLIEKGIVSGVDFNKIACEIASYYKTDGNSTATYS